MTVYRWYPDREYEHLGKLITVPAWVKQEHMEALTTTDLLHDYLMKEPMFPSGWWQLKIDDKRQFCHWVNEPEAHRVMLSGLHVSDKDPPMIAINAGWVETEYNGRRYTGKVTNVHYGNMTGWRRFEGSTYEFMKVLGDQFEAETLFWERKRAK